MNTIEGKLLAEGQRIGIVAARFNEFITSKLLGGAKDAFVRHSLGARSVRDTSCGEEDGGERKI